MDFNKKLFNKGWAIYFTVLQYASACGFLFMVTAVILGATTHLHITVPTAVVMVLFLSFVTFPIVSIIKIGYRRNLRWSKIAKDKDGITYDKLAEKMQTAAGRVEEHHLYKITAITSVQEQRRYYIVNGTIEKTIINNGRILSVNYISSVKIPNAYTGLDCLKK